MLIPRSHALLAVSIGFLVGHPPCLGAESSYRLIHGLNSLDGVTMTWGGNVTDKDLRLCTDARYRSEGAGSIHLRGVASAHKGNQYLAVKITVPPTDMTDRRLRFDAWTTTPQNTNALYVRYYNPKGQMVSSWNNWSSPFRRGIAQTFALRSGASGRGFRYEANSVSGRPCNNVVAIEFIIGTREKNVPFDVFIDNVRLSKQTVVSASQLKKAKKLYLDTRLTKGGEPNAVIVCPKAAAYRAVAKRVVRRIRERGGASLPVVSQLAPDEMKKTNAILLGNVNTNRSLAPLYAYSYVAADAVYPGAGGHVVRTVHDPWGTGANAVLLGGSNATDVSRAADEMLKRLKGTRDIVLPRTLKVKFGADPAGSLRAYAQKPSAAYVAQRIKSAKAALARGAHGGITSMVADAGVRYGLTGHEAYARAFKELVFLMHDHYLSKPKTFGGPWGMDADFRLYRVMPALDLADESPSLTDKDRLRIANIYVLFINDCLSHAVSVLGHDRPRHNHETFPSLGLLYAGAYFKKYYAADEADYWLEIADACFNVQALGMKPHEDCNGYQWLTQYHLMRYTLSRPDFTYFHNGNAQRAVDYAILCMDNFGYQVPYGDTGPYRCWWSELPYLRAAAWFTGDRRYQFALSKKAKSRPAAPMYEYAHHADSVEPVDLLGTRAFPVERRFYDAWREGRPAYAVTVDKVVMRASFDLGRQYLLLDGLSNGGHKHYDGNSISRITDRGRIWLADADYIRSLPKYHNGVLVMRDGQSAKIPPYCELENIADFDTLGFSETVVRNYAGANWHRNIIWAKERYFLVIDEMEATEADNFSFRTVWQTVGEAECGDKGLTVEQKGTRFFIKQAPALRVKLYDDADQGKNWRGYPHAEPVVRVFQQIGDAQLRKGESFRFFNLLHCSDDARPLSLEVRQVSDGCAAVLGDAPAFVGTGRSDEAESIAPGVRVAADMFHLESDGYALVAATGLDWQDVRVVSDRPINIDARNGRAVIVAGKPTRVELPVGQREPRLIGRVARVERQRGRVVLHGVTGRCEVAGVVTSLPRFDETLQRAIEKPPPSRRPAEPGRAPTKAPTLEQLWSLKEKLDAYLLTNNAGYFEGVDTGCSITCDPAPLAANVFSGAADGTNSVRSLADGAIRTAQGCVMWDTDRPVTLLVDLKNRYQLSRIKLKAWWADSSSKNKTYQLHRAVLDASNDAFARDVRKLGEIVDTKRHGNWDAPGYGPEDYELAGLDAEARYVRISMTPRKGTGIYVAELEIWGNREGLEIDMATKKKRGLPVHVFQCLHASDVDGDGRDEIIAGLSNGSVYLTGGDGETRWTYDTGDRVNAVAAAELAPGKVAVVTGSANARVHAIAADGDKLWAYDIPVYKGQAVVRTIFPADLNGDGEDEIVAGANSWRYYAFDAAGKQVWQFESVRKATVGAAADLDRDGKDEVIAGTNYYWWTCINGDGSRRWRYVTRSGPYANDVTAGHVTGDKKLEVVFGGRDSHVHVVDSRGKLLWKYSTGDEVTAVAVCDLDGDGVGEVLAASKSFSVYAFNGKGKRLWRVDLRDAVSDMAVLKAKGGKPLIAAGTEAGRLVVIDGSGTITAERAMSGAVLKLVGADLDGDGQDEIVVSSDDGSLCAVKSEVR